MKVRICLLATTIGALTACHAEPSAEIASGTESSEEYADHVEYFDLDLPEDAGAVEWVTVATWDSNEIFLRFETSRPGVRQVLRDYAVTRSEVATPTI